MSATLPPVTDCGCAASTASAPSGGACCALVGLNDPNADGITPTDLAAWTDYWQVADLLAGPVVQTWYWNPNLAVWQ